MTITDALLGEHGVFYAQFDYLENVLPSSDDLTSIKALGAMLAAAFVPHAKSENELLFPLLEPHLGKETGPVVVMRLEHDRIEQGLSRLPAVDDASEANGLVLSVVHDAREHFAKEEQILYPAALEVLGAEHLTQIAQDWARRRGVHVS